MPQTLKLEYNELVKERLSSVYPLKEVDIEPDLKYIKAEKDGAIMEHVFEAYSCKKIKIVRLAKLNAEGAVYVRNAVIAPEDDYDFPLFSYDIVEAPRRMFAILDITPWRKTDDYKKKYVEPMKAIYESWQDIPVIEGAKQELSEWAREFDSGYKLYLRCEKEYEPRINETLKKYLDLYLKFLKEAEPIKDPAVKKEILEYKNYYKDVYRENDPGKGPVTVFFGKEWTERFFKDFPF